MKKNIIILIVSFIGLYIYDHFFTNEMLLGTYVNRHYENKYTQYASHVPDTLVLKEDNRFESAYYDKGKYKLNYKFKGTRIVLTYGEGYTIDTINGERFSVPNQMSFDTYINRIWYLGNPKIILNEDLNQYYEKID